MSCRKRTTASLDVSFDVGDGGDGDGGGGGGRGSKTRSPNSVRRRLQAETPTFCDTLPLLRCDASAGNLGRGARKQGKTSETLTASASSRVRARLSASIAGVVAHRVRRSKGAAGDRAHFSCFRHLGDVVRMLIRQIDRTMID